MAKQQVNHDFFEAVRREHDELRSLLSELHKTIGAATVAEVADSLESLSTHIETHFHDEEVAGFFDQVVERAPRLSECVDHLRAEHQSLREAVHRLRDAASGDGSPGWRQALQDAFHEFSKDLMHHENNENQLLQQAYFDDIGSAD